MVDRFQEFDDEWFENEESTLVDVSKITQMPMTFFIGTNDPVCPYPTARKFIKQIKAPTKSITVLNEGHLWFSSEANTEWFMTHLVEELQVPSTTLLQ